MEKLKKESGYESLKTQYSKNFPALGKQIKPSMVENEDDDDKDESECNTSDKIKTLEAVIK